ncbi:beta-glucuronidase isoform X1 [Drosophila serrata]|uniref:beta-glucuronidase isoform X1 n=1 Tax=Drosophila serrata TaxID=7274 RepID=UPI000A1D0AB2|nr:beta-glucuronidase isoform X1 [Drosophila serrata]
MRWHGPSFTWFLVLPLFLLQVFTTGEGIPESLDANKEWPLFEYGEIKKPTPTKGLLYPRESETREVRSLDGMWRLVKSNPKDPLQGVREKWFANSLRMSGRKVIPMPVPASYNDIATTDSLRDHVGTVWYERTFFVSRLWQRSVRTWLRFGSVHYSALVWINGKNATSHSIGHLPFEADISGLLDFGGENRITVMCDNRLGNRTIPQGSVYQAVTDKGPVPVQSYTFDFFNYAGIHRSVHLYTTPLLHISDLEVSTQYSSDEMGRIDYRLWVDASQAAKDRQILPTHLMVELRDREGLVVAQQINRAVYNGSLLVPNAKPWWPYLMNPDPGYLYDLQFKLFIASNKEEDGSALQDAYRLPVGIRTLSWNNQSLLLNGVPIYLRGFGRHEDSDIRGKGLDNALLARDFNLLQWIGANAYRTSHYPYSEESMQFADEQGIMIIDECPAVNIDIFEPQLLEQHMSSLEQLIHRDRNHPSVVAWSVANEPRSTKQGALKYFEALVNYTQSIAQGRPLTAAINASPSTCHLAQFLDIVGFNRYNSWYQNSGRTDMIVDLLTKEAQSWRDKFGKPVIQFEYGGDTMEGMHSLPAFIWSEEYQVQLFSKHFRAFDDLREKLWFIGEFVWNFADFRTAQTITRVGGNKKGVFTRNRQPKEVAHILRKRYYAIAHELDRCTLPEDLTVYISREYRHNRHNEL